MQFISLYVCLNELSREGGVSLGLLLVFLRDCFHSRRRRPGLILFLCCGFSYSFSLLFAVTLIRSKVLGLL